MRRVAAVALVGGLMALSLGASATGTEHIKDKFDSISWGGSNGSLPWAGNWSEINDDGDEKKGNVRVVSSGNCPSNICMRLSGLLSGHGARRGADTSQLEDLQLRYDVKNVVTLLPLGVTELAVQIKNGGSWQTVATHNLGSNFSNGFTYEDIPGSANFEVRFVITGLAMTSEVYVDNVEISGQSIEATTTTTTTTTTSTTSTTTTTHPTTTTTTTVPTTTTAPRSTTSSTAADPGGGGAGSTTSTTSSSTTTTNPPSPTTTVREGPVGGVTGSSSTTTTSTVVGARAVPIGAVSGTTPDGSGIRAAARGLQADFSGDLYGEIRTVASLNGVDFRADYNMAVEVIQASWGWIVLLALLLAYLILSGLDRRLRLPEER